MGAFREVNLHPRALRFGDLAHSHHHRQKFPNFSACDSAIIQVHRGRLPPLSASRDSGPDSQSKNHAKPRYDGQLPQSGPRSLSTSKLGYCACGHGNPACRVEGLLF